MGPEYLIFSASYERYYALGLYSIHRETRRQKELLSGRPHKIFDTLPNDAERFLIALYSKRTLYPDLSLIDINGLHPVIHFPNPGEATWFIDDYDESIRLIHFFDGNRGYYKYRPDEDSDWRRVKFPLETVPLEFDRSGDFLHVTSSRDSNTMGLYRFDLERWELDQPILSHPNYDIQSFHTANNRTRYQRLISGHQYGGLIVVSFETQIPVTVWLNPEFQSLQQLIDKTLPDTINIIISSDDALRRFVIHSFSDREPGVYNLFDVEQMSLTLIGKVNDMIEPAAMAKRTPIKVPTRDGAVIEGYLTVPRNISGNEPLPMVVLVHGCPWVRDSFEFDPEAQFFANRGYVVLQVNYRGSAGYGKKHMEASVREMGGMMKDDITDAVHWAIDRRIADRDRIAIMGWSFGGYSTVHGLVNHPDLYRCGIALSGVYDWVSHLNERKTERGQNIYKYITSIYGDPEKKADYFNSISLLDKVEAIEDPLLLVHGDRDMVVNDRQSRKLAKAMRAAGKKVTALYNDKERHGFVEEKNRFDLYRKIEVFLSENL